jgi:hypothetical protein
MSIVEPGPASSEGLVGRVRGLLMSPAAEWDKIDAEPATIAGLYSGYVVILAAIPIVARLIGSLVFGYGAFGIVYRPPIITAIVGAVVGYVLALALVYVLALVIDMLAPSFDGQKNPIQAFKVAAYSGTAGWVAGVVGIFPPLGLLAVLGALYGLYILYLGLPKLMRVPQEKGLGYTVVTLIVAVVLFVVVGAVTGAVGGMAMLGSGGLSHIGSGGTVTGSLNVPGGSVDLGKLNAATAALKANADQMRASTNQLQASTNGAIAGGAVKAVAPDVLKGLLPAALPAGFSRTDVSAEGSAVGGMSNSHASGTYTRGDGHITLEVSDLAAAGALAGMAGALNVESDKQTATGYEKVGKVDGRLTTESYDTQAKSGKYSVIVANRFVVEANGSGVGMDELKGAVSSVGFGQLEGLARG